MTHQHQGLIDICFNCTHDSFQKDLDRVLQRAKENHIIHMLVPSSSAKDSRHSVAIAERHRHQLTAGVGVHPHLAREWEHDTLVLLQDLVTQHPTAFVGEAGLDYYRNYSSPQEQHLAFEQQIELAKTNQRPMLLHQRDAHSDFMSLLKPYRDALTNVVVHCFTGSKKELFDYLDMDLHIGITGWVCDERRGQNLKTLLRHIPTNRLLLETDAPYLLPRSLSPGPKQHRNEPAFLNHVAETIAESIGCSLEALAQSTRNNTIRFFHLDQLPH